VTNPSRSALFSFGSWPLTQLLLISLESSSEHCDSSEETADALAFPPSYRTCVGLEGPEAARTESAHALEMTMHWSRTLFDWYTR
jgi:hypothetical protein